MDAIFLGTFNPPHIGHLNCIQSVLDHKISEQIDKIHIIPCYQNPNKSKGVDFDIRYRMCIEMFNGFSDKIIIDNIEKENKWKYTYNMLEYFSNNSDKYISSDFLWIITTETFDELVEDKWYKGSEILNKYYNKMIVIGKLKTPYTSLCYQYVQIRPGIDIHSTDIRNLIKENKRPNIYLNDETIGIIKENNLYI